MCTKGDSGHIRGAIPTANPINRKGWPHRRGLRPLLLANSDVGSFTSHKNKSVIVLWDGTYGFLSLSEMTRKSNHLQMSLKRKFALCMATGTPNSRKVLRLKSSSRTPESPKQLKSWIQGNPIIGNPESTAWNPKSKTSYFAAWTMILFLGTKALLPFWTW